MTLATVVTSDAMTALPEDSFSVATRGAGFLFANRRGTRHARLCGHCPARFAPQFVR